MLRLHWERNPDAGCRAADSYEIATDVEGVGIETEAEVVGEEVVAVRIADTAFIVEPAIPASPRCFSTRLRLCSPSEVPHSSCGP